MRDEGVTGVQSLSPVPTVNVTIAQARELLGADRCIIGGIEPTTFLDLSLKDLGSYVEQTIEEARGGPFVLANSDSCPPGVTVEKMKLAAEIAHATFW